MVEELFDELEFDEEAHAYTLHGVEMQGVTSLIKQFFPGFDAKYWSKRIAKEAREEIKNYEEGDQPKRMMKLFPDTWELEVERRQHNKVPINAKTVKKLWNANGQRARDEGTRVHNEIEGYFLGDVMLEEIEDYRTHSAINVYMQKNNLYRFDSRYPELRVYDDELGIAGTIDLVCLKGDKVVLMDWKTNKKDLFVGKGRAKAPLRELDTSSYSQYLMQLSVYAYILERVGLTPDLLLLVHLKEGGVETHEVPYRKDLVEEMLKAWNG